MPDDPHGTRRQYVKAGCRCDACEMANRLYMRQYRDAYRTHRLPLGAHISAVQAWRIIRRFQHEHYSKAQIARLLGLRAACRTLKLNAETVTLRTYLRLRLLARRYLQEPDAVHDE